MNQMLRLLPILAALLLAGPAFAMPIVAVDTDPGTPGVQDSSIVLPGSSFTVDIVISGVDAASPLNGFELDLDFDPAVLKATSVVDGGFLLAPKVVVQQTIGGMSVEFAETSLLPAGASGDGVLVSISFDVVGMGGTLLDLNDVILAAPFGIPIRADVKDGKIATDRPVGAIPEPTSALLYAAGAVVIARATRRSRAPAA